METCFFSICLRIRGGEFEKVYFECKVFDVVLMSRYAITLHESRSLQQDVYKILMLDKFDYCSM